MPKIKELLFRNDKRWEKNTKKICLTHQRKSLAITAVELV